MQQVLLRYLGRCERHSADWYNKTMKFTKRDKQERLHRNRSEFQALAQLRRDKEQAEVERKQKDQVYLLEEVKQNQLRQQRQLAIEELYKKTQIK